MKLPDTVDASKNFSARSALAFLIVGAFATGIHYLITALLVVGFGVALVLASAAGFTISAIANYFLNKRLTFRSRQSVAETAPRFVATAGAGLLINCLLLALLDASGLHPVIAQLLSTVGVLIWNYSINGLWTFRNRAS